MPDFLSNDRRSFRSEESLPFASDNVPALSRIVELTADIIGVSVGAIGIIEGCKLSIKAVTGAQLCSLEWRRQINGAFFSEEVAERIDYERHIEDNWPLQTDALPDLRFCAAKPLISSEGRPLGALIIGDRGYRQSLDKEERKRLRWFADIVVSELEHESEIAERKNAQREARRAQTDLEIALNLSKTASWQIDLESGAMSWGGAFEAIWGEPNGATLSNIRDVLARIHPEDRQNVEKAISVAAAEEGKEYDLNFRIIRDPGEVRWIAGRGNAMELRDRHTLAGVFLDITNDVQQQEAAVLLVRELHHRLRNLFARLQSILRLSKQSSTSVEDYFDRIDGRLRALNRAQEILLHADFMSGSLAALMSDLTQEDNRIVLQGDDVVLAENAIVSLSLALNELVSNARRHGALSIPEGRVAISWSIDENFLELVWAEKGPVQQETDPISPVIGFGLSLVDQSVQGNLRGYIAREWTASGLICKIRFRVE